MNDYEKLEWIHSAIQEAIVRSKELEIGLETALRLLEDVREKYLVEVANNV